MVKRYESCYPARTLWANTVAEVVCALGVVGFAWAMVQSGRFSGWVEAAVIGGIVLVLAWLSASSLMPSWRSKLVWGDEIGIDFTGPWGQHVHIDLRELKEYAVWQDVWHGFVVVLRWQPTGSRKIRSLALDGRMLQDSGLMMQGDGFLAWLERQRQRPEPRFRSTVGG